MRFSAAMKWAVYVLGARGGGHWMFDGVLRDIFGVRRPTLRALCRRGVVVRRWCGSANDRWVAYRLSPLARFIVEAMSQ